MPGFEVDPIELFVAQARLVDAASDGRTELARLESLAEDVLGGTWRGSAATAFRAGYDEWLAGVRTLLVSLDDLAGALAAAGHDYERAETANHSGFVRMAS